MQGCPLGYRSVSELAMKRDRGLDLKNKVKALKWNTSFLYLGVIGATYHNGQDTSGISAWFQAACFTVGSITA